MNDIVLLRMAHVALSNALMTMTVLDRNIPEWAIRESNMKFAMSMASDVVEKLRNRLYEDGPEFDEEVEHEQ